MYTYQPIYSGDIFEIEGEIDQKERDRVMNNLVWNCQVNGPMGKYYRAKASFEDGPISSNQRISCTIERIPGVQTEKMSSKVLLLTVSATNEAFNFYFSKNFEEDELDILVVLSERKINPEEHESPYHVIIETKEKLEVYQTGGKNECIIGN